MPLAMSGWVWCLANIRWYPLFDRARSWVGCSTHTRTHTHKHTHAHTRTHTHQRDFAHRCCSRRPSPLTLLQRARKRWHWSSSVAWRSTTPWCPRATSSRETTSTHPPPQTRTRWCRYGVAPAWDGAMVVSLLSLGSLSLSRRICGRFPVCLSGCLCGIVFALSIGVSSCCCFCCGYCGVVAPF